MKTRAFLLIDAGNTAVKSAVVRSESCAAAFECQVSRLDNSQADVAGLTTQWSELASDQGLSPHDLELVWICVGPASIKTVIASAYEAWAQRSASLPLIAQREQSVGFTKRVLRSHYEDHAQLGADRWVSALGMTSLLDDGCMGSHLIVSAGTATTIDLIEAAHVNGTVSAKFSGGWILPGLAMMQDGLRTGTAGLGDQVGLAAGSLLQVPRNSAQAIAQGIALAQAGFLGLLAEQFSVRQIWLHGGAAVQWRACLEISEVGKSLSKGLRCQDALLFSGLASLALEDKPPPHDITKI